MAEFDIEGARKEGYSDAEIADYLGSQKKFDVSAARSEGYSDADIIGHLQTAKAPKSPATFGERGRALSTGINTGLIGGVTLPFDVAANAVDVGSALLGAGYLGADAISRKFGGDGVDIPAFIGPVNRRNQIGTLQNTKAQIEKLGIETENPRPDDAISRGLNLVGTLGGGLLSGSIYNKFLPPQAGAPPAGFAPPGTPVGGRPGAPPPPNAAPPGTPVGGPPGIPPPPAPGPGSLGGPPVPAPTGLNATERATLAAGERLGLQVTPGVRAGSPTLRQIEASLESFPSTSGPFNTLKANNARVVQREFLRAIGEQGDEVSAAALANASTRIGKVFEDAAGTTKVAYDNDLQNALSQIGSRAAAELTEQELPIIQRQLGEVLNRASSSGGAIDGPAFNNIYSQVGRIQKNGVGSVKDLAGEIRDALHDALVRSAGPKVGDKLRTARDQYRILRTAENSGAIDVGSGSLKAGQLGSAFRRLDNAGYQRAYNDSGLYDALRFSNTRSFGPIVGNSGTATRANIQGLFDAGRFAAGNLASRAYLNTPAPVLNAGVRAGNATNELVRDMLKIPRNNAPGVVIGANAAEEDLRRGLFQ